NDRELKIWSRWRPGAPQPAPGHDRPGQNLMRFCPGRFLHSEKTSMLGTMTQTQSQVGEEFGSLVRRCQRGDAAAWRRLLEEARQSTTELARRSYRLDREDAEDVAQAVQIRIVERLGQLREPRAFPLWVRRLVHTAAVDLIRQRRPHLSLDAP